MQGHVFEGDIKILKKGKSAETPYASGMHHPSAIGSGKARIDETSIERGVDNPDVIKAKTYKRDSRNGKWVPKSNNEGNSTFFPSSWSKLKTLEEIAYAYQNILKDKNATLVEGNIYTSWSTDHSVKMQMFLTKDDRIISAFPVID